MVDDDGGEVKGGEIPRFEIEATHEAKLNEILHKINSIEIKLCSDGVKEFIKLLEMLESVAYYCGIDEVKKYFWRVFVTNDVVKVE
uniref:Uncharacterized protein n=1 Tax=Quercus lobata TaxID=97700 RepID=A0A7N2RC33_QUELO